MSKFIDTNEWVPVHTLPGYECAIEYHVNRNGDLKSTKGGRERILKRVTLKNGYQKYTIQQRLGQKSEKQVYAHTLVALAFLDICRAPAGALQISRGGDTHQFPKWWSLKNRVLYIEAAIFKVTLDSGTVVNLVIPLQENTEVKVVHDGNGNFTFPKYRGVDRIAVVSSADKSLYREYQFPSISKGPILTRTVASYPTPEQSVAFSAAATISGTATVGQTLTATAATYTGGKGTVTTNLIFQVSDDDSSGWTFPAGNPGTASGATATYTLTGAESGKYIRASYQVTDDEATHTSNSIGTGPVAATFSTRVANATFSYTVGVNNIGTEELPQNVYTLNGVDGPGIAGSVGDSFAFDFSAVSAQHPLGIFTDSSKNTPVTVGVTVEGDVLLFEPPIAGTFSYQFINPANMGGSITVTS